MKQTTDAIVVVPESKRDLLPLAELLATAETTKADASKVIAAFDAVVGKDFAGLLDAETET